MDILITWERMDQKVHKQGGKTMKKVVLVITIVLLVTTFCYAQAVNNPVYIDGNYPGKTTFGVLETTGLDSGVPGYLMLKGVGPAGWRHADGTSAEGVNTNANSTYVLWVDDTGDLMLCSYATISGYSSFPTGIWTSGWIENQMPSCSKVGGQS